MGFKRVTDIIGPSPNFKNADYIHFDAKVLVELKILDKDYFQKGGVIDRFHGFVGIPKEIDKNGMGIYTTTFPPPNREGINDTFEEPLRRILKTGNRQLKETKGHFFDGKGVGIIMIALNSFRSLPPITVLHLVMALLENEFSAIDGCIVCTPSWGLNQPSPCILHPRIAGLGGPTHRICECSN